jgi:formylglycine-generating enzyme required for sulfatase activity
MSPRDVMNATPQPQLDTWLCIVTFITLLAVPGTMRGDIGYQFVTVGNPGNPGDHLNGDGQVGYVYDIGTYDVTLNQYTTFLNAVGQSDPYGLYNTSLATDLNVVGIARSGTSGSYNYSVIGDGNRPVTYVSWLDAARLANWMQNGQPTGLGEVAASTEQGAYTLNGDTASGLETKNANATYWIPTETEWYKAAYYDPALNGGAGGYWSYATRSNTAPGNVVGSAPNQANYLANLLYSVTQSSSYSSSQNYLTDVGAFSNSASAYGTYDQSGDVFQWTDATSTSNRVVRGGMWYDGGASSLDSFSWSVCSPSSGVNTIGFRLATVPEPSVAVNFIVAGGLLLTRRKRRSAI